MYLLIENCKPRHCTEKSEIRSKKFIYCYQLLVETFTSKNCLLLFAMWLSSHNKKIYYDIIKNVFSILHFHATTLSRGRQKWCFEKNVRWQYQAKTQSLFGVFPEKSRFRGFLLNQPFINLPSLRLLKGIMDSPCLLNFLINTKTKRWNLGLTPRPHSLETRNKKMKSQPVSMKISTIHNKISICDHENLDLSSWKSRLFIVKSRPVIMKMNSTFSRNGFS